MYTLKKCLEDINFYSHELTNAKAKLSKAPSNSLVLQKKKKKYYWYERDHKTQKVTYIPRKNISKAQRLALKAFYKQKCKYCQMMLKALNAFRDSFDLHTGDMDDFLKANPGITELLEIQKLYSPEVRNWINLYNPPSTYYEENLKIKTLSGILVRSKSECLIADSLLYHMIPFKYEYTTEIGMTLISPDFTIMHPRTEEIIIWEHFGMIDNPEYAGSMLTKIRAYIEVGYVIGKNLIVTFETSHHPLDSETVEYIITKFFE